MLMVQLRSMLAIAGCIYYPHRGGGGCRHRITRNSSPEISMIFYHTPVENVLELHTLPGNSIGA